MTLVRKYIPSKTHPRLGDEIFALCLLLLQKLMCAQKTPRLKVATPPILHLPLAFPPQSTHQLTTWSTINLKLPNLLPRFTDGSLLEEEEGQSGDEEGHDWGQQPKRARLTGREPSGLYSHVSYVRVYATCRLRRIWFSEAGPAQDLPWEFELYSVA